MRKTQDQSLYSKNQPVQPTAYSIPNAVTAGFSAIGSPVSLHNNQENHTSISLHAIKTNTG